MDGAVNKEKKSKKIIVFALLQINIDLYHK